MSNHSIGRRPFLKGALSATALLAVPGRLFVFASQPGGGPAALPDRYPPIIPGFPHILHGGDWSPEQWLHEPAVIEEDFRLMEKTGCNTFSVGIFSWATRLARHAAHSPIGTVQQKSRDVKSDRERPRHPSMR